MPKNYLSEARRLADKTQQDVADHLGMNQSTYSTKEGKLDFTSLEWKKIRSYVGSDNIDEARGASTMVSEPLVPYGQAGSEYRKLLTGMNEVINLQKTNMAIVAELFAEMKGQKVAKVIERMKVLYKEKTGKEIDL